jgi:hypothetical protein
MGKTPAPARASHKPKSKIPERKWCTCQERCDGGKEVAASTYRSHNQAAARSATARGSLVEDGGLVGGKRKVMNDEGGLDSGGGGVRETRRMRTRRVAETESRLSKMDQTRPQERKKVDGSKEFYAGELTIRP